MHPATPSPADVEHALRPQYLDSPRERASLCILREIGVTALAHNPSNDLSLDIVPLTPDLLAEHTRAATARYAVSSGRVLLDVRDAGDAWIRVLLSPGLTVDVDGAVSRRFLPDATLPTDVQLVLHTKTETSAVVPRFQQPTDALENIQYHAYRELICELCRQFYTAGWVTGTGGSISIRYGNRIYMTPSGVSKERIAPDDLYLLDLDGAILDAPSQKPGTRRAPKLSDCSPLFLHAYRLRGAGAVLHSHGLSCNLVTALCDGQREFRISHQEMIKGLAGHGYHDELVIPIIENTARESELADALAEAIAAYPKASAVLVRRHGIYVWGDSWDAAKRHGECLHYLFEVALEMHRRGMDWTAPPPGVEEKKKNKQAKHKYVLLDIEGTTTPITFVHDVLFPFARDHAHAFLTRTWESPATQADVQALRDQAAIDQKDTTLTTVPAVAAATEAKDAVIRSLVAYVHWNITADRKIASLKQLQGHIWDVGYQNGDLKSVVFADVPRFLERMTADGVRVGIYSSGSRNAQRALFKHSDHGDLRHCLSVYFDTKVGHKREPESYREILQSLGVDSGADVLFVTDVLQEAEAARAAGMDTVLSVRPGNAPLPADHPFREVRSFDEL